jgi:metal-dependent HD superfamily phosphatase/phosphodiesterase
MVYNKNIEANEDLSLDLLSKILTKYIKKRNMRVTITKTHRCILHAINRHRAPVDIAFL